MRDTLLPSPSLATGCHQSIHPSSIRTPIPASRNSQTPPCPNPSLHPHLSPPPPLPLGTPNSSRPISQRPRDSHPPPPPPTQKPSPLSPLPTQNLRPPRPALYPKPPSQNTIHLHSQNPPIPPYPQPPPTHHPIPPTTLHEPSPSPGSSNPTSSPPPAPCESVLEGLYCSGGKVSVPGLDVAGEETMCAIAETDHPAQRGAYTAHQAIQALRSPQVEAAFSPSWGDPHLIARCL